MVEAGLPEVRARPRPARPARPAKRARRPTPDAGIVALLPLLTVILALGWSVRHEDYLTAESGPGYALGIAGLAMMLALLLYTPRKRLRALHDWGPIRWWFRTHMLLGLFGPAAILFHANFRLGSTNSTIALVSMLLVMGSGVVGRFIYARIHHGLYGRRASLTELRAQVEELLDAVAPILAGAPQVALRLRRLEESALRRNPGWLTALVEPLWLGVRARGARRAALRTVRAAGRLPHTANAATAANAEEQLREYVACIQRVVALRAYERIFAAWHVAHLPLCVLLFAAAAAHVVAVHLY